MSDETKVYEDGERKGGEAPLRSVEAPSPDQEDAN